MTKGPCAMRGLLHGPLVFVAPQGRRGIRERYSGTALR